MSEVTEILNAVARGEAGSAEELLGVLYEELRKLAALKMSRENTENTLQPTALVHEAWLRLGGDNQPPWQNRGHFFAAAAEAMRRILIDRARRRQRVRHGGGQERLDLAELQIAAPEEDEKLLRVHDALDRLAAEDPAKADVVKLRFFVGLTDVEVSEVLGLSKRTVERHWAYAKAWLFDAMRRPAKP